MQQQEIWVTSTLDGTAQPSLFYRTQGKRPLLVGLHTWSFDRFNQVDNLLPMAKELNFHLLLPEFRGKNLASNPNCTQACGSEYARQDIRDAIDHVIAHEDVDSENVFLLGLSGGGHMALLMAGKCPEYFKAIGAYVPITDLNLWAQQSPKYREHILACCGTQEEMHRRSPVCYMDTIAKANLKIFHGKYDRTVPVSQSIGFFNSMMEKYPQSKLYLDIFDGAHEIDLYTARHWILSQYGEQEKAQVTG